MVMQSGTDYLCVSGSSFFFYPSNLATQRVLVSHINRKHVKLVFSRI